MSDQALAQLADGSGDGSEDDRRGPKRRKVPAEKLNRLLQAGQARADELEPRLVRVLQEILDQAGTDAANRFEEMATDHLTAATKADITGDSTMVALYPTPEQALQLAERDGEPPEVMHVTLCYLGDIDATQAQTVADALTTVAATHGPLEGQVGGVGMFAGGDIGHPAILLPSVRGLAELRADVCAAVLASGVDYPRTHGFLPHLTVAYRDHPAPPDPGLIGTPLAFGSIRIARGNELVAEHPLTGVLAVTAAGDDVERPKVPQWTPPAADEIIDVDAVVAKLRTKTDPVRQAFVQTIMTPVLEAAGLVFDISNPLTAHVLSQAGSQIKDIAATTRLNVMRIISRSYDQGLSIRDTSKAIREGMREASKTRATLIARTELVGAVNGGSVAATRLVEEATGDRYTKEWLTSPGARYPRHEEYDDLDGQQRPLDGAFDVGGFPLMFPGDPDGPPEEVCNCRCALVYGDGTEQAEG